MRIPTVSLRPTRRRAIDLMVGTALGCSLLVVANPAAASDECGPAVGGVVTCTAAGSPYATGIRYTAGAGGLTMNFQAGTTVEIVGGGNAAGVILNGSGPVTMNARDTTIRVTSTTGASDLRGISAFVRDDLAIHAGTVQVVGRFSTGIDARLLGDGSGERTIEVTAESVSATGLAAHGVVAYNDSGDVDIAIGTITTTGEGSTGASIFSSRDATLDVDAIVMSGAGAAGISLDAERSAAVNVGSVTTSGDDAFGIRVAGETRAVVEFNTVATDGRNATGVFVETDRAEVVVRGGSVTARGGGDDYGAAIRIDQYGAATPGAGPVTVEVESIVTGEMDDEFIRSGDNGHGLQVNAVGDVNFDIGSIVTFGDQAEGVRIGTQGLITGAVGSITTRGDDAHGMNLASTTGLEVEFDSITTYGDYAIGAMAYVEGDARITGRAIETSGDGAHGVLATSGYGDITVDLGTVKTSGEAAFGVWVQGGYDDGALIDLTIDSIETSGEGSVGLLVQPQQASMTMALGSVKTTGDYATALFIEQGVGGALTLTAEEISTTGFSSSAIGLNQGGDATVTLGTVTTRGDFSRGIEILRDPELSGPATVVLNAGAVQTGHVEADGTVTGYDAAAILISNGGDTTVNVGTVTTLGDVSDAISIDAQGTGKMTLTATDDIRTDGENSRGVHIAGTDGAVVQLADVSTKGANSSAIIINDFEDLGERTGGLELVAGDISTLGDTSRGIAVQAAGDVDITVGDISTKGYISGAFSASSGNGSLEIRAGDIHTSGAASSGLQADALEDVTITAGDITTMSSASRGVEASSISGNVTLTLGDVVTEGRSGSDAITVSLGAESGVVRLTAGAVEARNGPDNEFNPGNSAIVVQNAGFSGIRLASALTNSVNAAAIQIEGGGTGDVDLHVTGAVVSTGNRSEGVRVLNAADVDIRAAEVRTAGEDSAAVRIGAVDNEGTDDVTVAIGQVRTTGLRSHGLDILTAGDVAVTSDLVSATGLESRAIMIDAGGAVVLHLGSASASATDGVAIEASGQSVELTVATELRGTRVGADLTAAEALAVTLGAGSSTSGSVFGLDLSSGAGTTLTNRGSLSSTGGVALNVDGGAATISNIGNLVGRIDLTEAADRLTNSGTFRLSGESDFGGASDVLDNTGILTFAEATTPTQARLRNLERFNNGGTIDLTNGVAGDVLTIDGALNGQAGNRVLLDLDTRTPSVVSDRLVVGSLEGVTNLELDVQGAGVIGDTGVTLVTSAIAQTGQEILVTTAGGFLDYDAVFDAGSREYRIVGAAAARAWEPTKVASGAQMQWRRGSDVVSARFDDLRDSGAMGLRKGGGFEAWAQAFSGRGEVDGERVIDGEAADLSHDVDVAGGQVGFDLVRGLGGGDLVLGLTGSISETELEFRSNGDKATFSGVGVGAYAQWNRGPLALGVLAKADSYDLEYDWISADLSDEADGSTFGVRVDAAWRIDAGPGWVIEPQASTWWTETSLDSISAEAGEVEFGDTNSLVGRVGVRVAHAMSLSNGAMVQPFVGVYGYNEFEGDNASRIHLGSQTLDVADAAADLWGEAVFGANVGHGPIQGFVQGEAAFGEISGFTARVGVRMNW